MAKPGWLHTSKDSGSGNDTVGVSTLAPHSGRTARNGNLTFRASGVTDRIVAVTQNGRPEYVTIESAKAAGQAGGNITISGKTNSSKLTFSLGTGDLVITLPAQYTAHSMATNNGENISGDPGAAQEIDYSITIPIPVNGGTGEKTKQIIVTANGGQTGVCLITQAATEATLTVTPASLTLDWEGAEQTLTVASNTTWEII